MDFVRKGRRNMKIAPYCLVLAAAMVLIGCREEHPAAPSAVDPAPMEVRTAAVASLESRLQTEVTGTVRSVNQAVIAAKVTGIIEKMPVVLGTQVQRGDLLVQVAAGEINARASQARTRLEQAERNLARERKLLDKNAATAENVKSLEETFQIAEAAYREVNTMQGYTTITAPFDGVVTRKNANVGDLAVPGSPLLHIEDLGRLQVVAAVPETLALQITVGGSLPIHLPAAGLSLDGTVAEIAPAVDPLSRSATVKIDIEQSPRLQPGQFARVAIPGAQLHTFSVPRAAVRRFGQMEIVFVIAENRARLRLVRTGAEADGRVEILAGLEPGEIVALPAGPGLVDGRPVRIIQ